ncbi:hypothetical protein, partial [Phaeovulum vinaykumarii]|uniref:hypothetical protein n=1 Tax=Phaeovulum vinaykumarii TaxID=407234 RepID=UPI001AECE3C0
MSLEFRGQGRSPSHLLWRASLFDDGVMFARFQHSLPLEGARQRLEQRAVGASRLRGAIPWMSGRDQRDCAGAANGRSDGPHSSGARRGSMAGMGR